MSHQLRAASLLSLSLLLTVGSSACTKNKGRDFSFDLPLEGAALQSAASLAKIHCTRCHAFPDPELLDRATWHAGVLPQMGYRMGIYEDTTRQALIEAGPGGTLVENSNAFPRHPVISQEQWERIKGYYLTLAPDRLTTPDNEALPEMLETAAQVPDFRISPPMITRLHYNPDLKQLYVADAKMDYSTINILDQSLASVSTLAVPSPVSHIASYADTLWVTLMGGFMPTDNPSGSIIKVFKPSGSREYQGFTTVLKNLQRPVATIYEDLDQDNAEDIVVCEYGNHTGKLSLFLNQQNGQYRQRVLSSDPGAISAVVRDLNRDNRPDIAVLMAQGNERIDIYYNQGEGKFEVENVLQFPPSYGSVAMSMTDWNQDGFDDIIYVNGDNADYSPIKKPYHGLRIFMNDGENHFEEAFFQPITGAYRAIPQDFDQDGDVDIATVSFFADLVRTPEEGFIFMENTSTEDSIRFDLRTSRPAASGRWITLEAADLDDDGRQELILGAFAGMAIQGDIDGQLGGKLVESSPTLMRLDFD